MVTIAAAVAARVLARANIPAPVVTRLSVSLPVPFTPNYETANIALSPDGGTLAYVGINNGATSLYVRTMNQFDVKPLAGTEGGAGSTPAMYWKTADGNGTPEQILVPEHPHRPSSFSPDGRFLAYTEVHPKSGLDIWTVRLDDRSPRQPELFLRTPFDEDLPLFSPDGRWVLYRSNESGRSEVYVAQFPGATVRRQISIDGGDQPLWAPDGKQVFYVNGNRIMSVDLNSKTGLQPAKPRVLFERSFSSSSTESGIWGHIWAVFPDGKRFLLVGTPPQPEVRELRVVLNWFEELKARVPTK